MHTAMKYGSWIFGSVGPIMAKALVQANCPHLIREELSA